MKTNNEAGIGFAVQNAKGGAVALAMQELWLAGQVCPVGARLVVRHVFESAAKNEIEDCHR
jgi:hypothetical protein